LLALPRDDCHAASRVDPCDGAPRAHGAIRHRRRPAGSERIALQDGVLASCGQRQALILSAPERTRSESQRTGRHAKANLSGSRNLGETRSRPRQRQYPDHDPSQARDDMIALAGYWVVRLSLSVIQRAESPGEAGMPRSVRLTTRVAPPALGWPARATMRRKQEEVFPLLPGDNRETGTDRDR
jgi:hypothetical protein